MMRAPPAMGIHEFITSGRVKLVCSDPTAAIAVAYALGSVTAIALQAPHREFLLSLMQTLHIERIEETPP